SLLCSFKGQKRQEVCIPVFQRFSAFSGLVGRYSTLLSQKRQEVHIPAFQKYSAFSVWWAGSLGNSILHWQKEMRSVHSRVPEIFCIFWFGR
ncbi:hypothetical protein K443DRAFT_116477, partial [Laccaria amethystina LaAM-08-1]